MLPRSDSCKADRFDYKRSSVFYGPGGRAVGLRLAHQLAVEARPAPGLRPNQLLVIAGAPTALQQ